MRVLSNRARQRHLLRLEAVTKAGSGGASHGRAPARTATSSRLHAPRCVEVAALLCCLEDDGGQRREAHKPRDEGNMGADGGFLP